MIQKQFRVRLKGFTTTVWSFNSEQATILAQAKAINYGRNYEFVSIEEIG